MRKCSRCGEVKPLEAFHRHATSKNSRESICKICRYNSNQQWKANNIVRHREYARNYNKRRRDAGYREGVAKYGLTQEGFRAMILAQNGKCCICDKTMVSPCVDHDHETMMVRGLLCRLCNAGLGALGDKPETLVAALRYLQRSNQGTIIETNYGIL